MNVSKLLTAEGALTVRGALTAQGAANFENDLIVLIDKFAFVIECKSGSITDSAKRGAPERFKKTLKELIIEPSEQAQRFINYLKSHRSIHHFRTKRGEKNIIDNQNIEY